MKKVFRLFCSSAFVNIIAWVSKMHFVFGGDYLFRIGTTGILLSLFTQIILSTKNLELKIDKLSNLFIINSFCLSIVFLGMMMKVSHIMNTQNEKDFILDFFGIPIITFSILLNISKINKFINASKNVKILFAQNVIMPWIIFLFSFLLYAIYSAILVRN